MLAVLSYSCASQRNLLPLATVFRGALKFADMAQCGDARPGWPDSGW